MSEKDIELLKEKGVGFKMFYDIVNRGYSQSKVVTPCDVYDKLSCSSFEEQTKFRIGIISAITVWTVLYTILILLLGLVNFKKDIINLVQQTMPLNDTVDSVVIVTLVIAISFVIASIIEAFQSVNNKSTLIEQIFLKVCSKNINCKLDNLLSRGNKWDINPIFIEKVTSGGYNIYDIVSVRQCKGKYETYLLKPIYLKEFIMAFRCGYAKSIYQLADEVGQMLPKDKIIKRQRKSFTGEYLTN